MLRTLLKFGHPFKAYIYMKRFQDSTPPLTAVVASLIEKETSAYQATHERFSENMKIQSSSRESFFLLT